jgi:hypothetical protein
VSSLKEELEAFGAIRAGYQQAKAMELLLKRCVKRDLYMSKETYKEHGACCLGALLHIGLF